ncbi:LOX5-like protein [Mya arenaria]|uniref:LOX5-like protein n=1 Tax=Mya arenaria TaxID=6604 RepID=A0ABY7FJ17_MYAAR|nr:LOX5-like protein [Mya arenaria]
MDYLSSDIPYLFNCVVRSWSARGDRRDNTFKGTVTGDNGWKNVSERLFGKGTLRITVMTGDKPRQSDTACVCLTLSVDGYKALEQKLEARFNHDFSRGQTDTFDVPNVQLPSEVDSIEISKCRPGDEVDWYIDIVKVQNMKTESSREFPVFRRLGSNEVVVIHNYDTYLPNDEFYNKLPKMLEQRQRELETAKRDYEYEYKDELPVMVKELPDKEKFSFLYEMFLGLNLGKFILLTSAFEHTDWGQTIEGVMDIFKYLHLKPPSDLERWRSDEKFGLQRLLGVNSNVIRRVKDMAQLQKLNVHENDVLLTSEDLTVMEAFNENRLFIVDHSIIQGCPTSERVILCSPIALFVRNEDDKIMPVAIQLFQNKTDDNPVFYPDDDEITWQLAKIWFNNADAQVHQSIFHLGYTHLIMEGFAVAAHRHLSTSHPIFKLLAPHFIYLMAINKGGMSLLLAEGKALDKVMSSGAAGGKYLIARYKTKWRLNIEGTLPADLEARGVGKEVIPIYPFRDDAMLTYDVIKRYVHHYVDLYYKDEDVLKGDEEIQNWRSDMTRPESQGGLGIFGVPGENDRFQTKEDLAIVLTSIIYTCSVGHAAVNFKQYDEYAFPLNYPSKLKGKPPTDKTRRYVRDILSILPPKPTHHTLLEVAGILSSRGTNSLGHFEVDYIHDPAAVELVKTFRKELETVSKTIKERNKQRPQELQYDYLDPQSIPNSISI